METIIEIHGADNVFLFMLVTQIVKEKLEWMFHVKISKTVDSDDFYQL